MPRKPIPKVSKLKGMPVDDYVAKLTESQQAIVSALRKIARKAAPDATEAIKWAQPIFEDDGPFAYIKPAKNHVTFGFWRGAELTDPKSLLDGGDRMKHVKLASTKDIDKAALTAFIKQAVELNRTKGNPTKR
jgi:hypothetical protein